MSQDIHNAYNYIIDREHKEGKGVFEINGERERIWIQNMEHSSTTCHSKKAWESNKKSTRYKIIGSTVTDKEIISLRAWMLSLVVCRNTKGKRKSWKRKIDSTTLYTRKRMTITEEDVRKLLNILSRVIKQTVYGGLGCWSHEVNSNVKIFNRLLEWFIDVNSVTIISPVYSSQIAN